MKEIDVPAVGEILSLEELDFALEEINDWQFGRRTFQKGGQDWVAHGLCPDVERVRASHEALRAKATEGRE